MKSIRPSMAFLAKRSNQPIRTLEGFEQVMYLCRRLSALQVLAENASELRDVEQMALALDAHRKVISALRVDSSDRRISASVLAASYFTLAL